MRLPRRRPTLNVYTDDPRWAERAVAAFTAKECWELKQALAGENGRYYGDGGTIHHTGHLDVETFGDRVVSVWFRCQLVAFEQHAVTARRAQEMADCHGAAISGVEVTHEA